MSENSGDPFVQMNLRVPRELRDAFNLYARYSARSKRGLARLALIEGLHALIQRDGTLTAAQLAEIGDPWRDAAIAVSNAVRGLSRGGEAA